MAQQSIKLYFTKSALTDSTDAGSVQDITGVTYLSLDFHERLWFAFDRFPEQLSMKRLYQVKGCLCMRSEYQEAHRGYLHSADADFNPASLIWANQPKDTGGIISSPQMLWEYDDEILQSTATSAEGLSSAAYQFAVAPSTYLTGPSGITDWIYVYTRSLKDGHSLPYLEIFYDDSETAVSKISMSTTLPTGTVDPRSAQSVAWKYVCDGYYRVAPFTQASAKFLWKKASDSNWNEIPVTGTECSLTIPADTFPTGAHIQWKMQGTDTEGTTSETTTYGFTTPSTQITADVFPTGSSVYPGGAIPFAWHFASSVGDFDQSAASIFWKKDTENEYHEIAISGNITSYRVPGNTFPTNSTIQWYLSGTDIGGTASSTSVQSFKTLTSKITPQDSPTSGYMDPRNAITFSWYFETAGGAVAQGSASLFWKVSTDVSYTEVQATGSQTSVAIPANTFPVASTIQWYIAGTDYGGVSSQSTVFSFSTAATVVNAICVSPIGTAEDGSSEITMTWLLTSADGSLPSYTELFWKTPAESELSWHTIHGSAEAFHSWTVDALYFPIGEIEWKVVATNRDGIEGTPGQAAFVCMRTPDPPAGLKATPVPMSTISWQSVDQEGYEICIDGEVVQKAYGPDTYSWQVEEPLANGVHSIRVRIQGGYGYWSNAAETSVSIQNEIPQEWEALTMAGSFDIDAVLSLSGIEDAETLTAWWYRDGICIGVSTADSSFTDRLALGSHVYFARILSQDGNYAESNHLTGTMSVQCPTIGRLSGGSWLSLRLSTSSKRAENYSRRRSGSLIHVMGGKFPIAELSEFETKTGTYDCAFRTAEEAAAFEVLTGETVIVKARGDEVTVGVLMEVEKTVTRFYISFRFSLQQIDYEDFVNG